MKFKINFYKFQLFFLILILINICSAYLPDELNNLENNKWLKKNYVTIGSGLSLICIASIVAIYAVIRQRNKSCLLEQNEDQEKGIKDDTLGKLFSLTAENNEKIINNSKRKSSIKNEDQRTAKVHDFLKRAMTLPQSVIQSVGILQPSDNTFKQINSNNQINPNSILASSQTGNDNDSFNNIKSTIVQNSAERPVNFKKPTAIKSPSSNYLKKSPSPTGSKTPLQHNQQIQAQTNNSQNAIINENVDKVENSSATKNNNSNLKSLKENDQDLINKNLIKPETENNSSSEFKLGKIQFCLKYNYEKHTITVTMIKCMNLPGKNTMNTYIKLQLLPDKKHKAKTRTIRKNQNPSYQEEFIFPSILPDQIDNIALHFTIMSFDRYSRDEVLGEVVHHLDQTQFDTLEKQVTFNLDICPKGFLLKAQGRGELLLSLCYNPSVFILSLVILKAKNLPKVNIRGLPDPYVKINLIFNNKRISKKKTYYKKRTLNPVYNETFSFDLSKEVHDSEVKNGNIDLAFWEKIKIELRAIDYDRIARNEIIGCLDLNIDSEDSVVRKHMRDMLYSPRKQVASWHKLREL